MKIAMTMPMMDKMEKHKSPMKSDFYFNNPDKVKEMKEYCDPFPVDVTGGFVPEDKSIDNLKKMEHSIRSQYPLGGSEE